MVYHDEVEMGQRVVVRIVDPDEYAFGCAAALEGAAGFIEELSTDRRRFLVRFDEPRPKWWTNQTPATAFWFEPKDLALEGSRS
jgi:hypothetical protein